jgi:hypothetical protein
VQVIAMPLVKFVYPAILTLVVGALLSAMVLRTGDPTALNPQLPQGSLKSGEEAPEATRDQQETGGGLVIASAAGNSPSSAHRLPSSLPELRSPVGPSSSPELLSPTEPSSSTELLSPTVPSSSTELLSPTVPSNSTESPNPSPPSNSTELSSAVASSGSPQSPSAVEGSNLSDLPSAVDRDDLPRPVERLAILQSPEAIKSASVVDRSYRFAARRQGRTLFIEGYVPDERTIEQLLAFARERFFNVAILNQAQLHAGAPSGFMVGARFALEQLSFLATGEVILRDKSIRLSGEGLYSETAEQTCAKFASLAPGGWNGTANIRWRQEEADENAFPACQSRQMP